MPRYLNIRRYTPRGLPLGPRDWIVSSRFIDKLMTRRIMWCMRSVFDVPCSSSIGHRNVFVGIHVPLSAKHKHRKGKHRKKRSVDKTADGNRSPPGKSVHQNDAVRLAISATILLQLSPAVFISIVH